MAWKYVQRNENGQYKTTEGGGGGGSSTFADLEDVDLSNLQDGQVPKYNSSTQKWENANESGGSGHNYSTTEQVVGTWIDGKPIYEKTFNTNSPSTTNVTIIQNITSLSMDSLVEMNGALGGTTPINWYLEYSAYCACWVNDAKTGIAMKIATDSFYNLPVHITLKYTKTTD